MPRQCAICGKNYNKATKRVLLRGHRNPTKTYKQKVNLQSKKINGKKIKICTSCIKSKTK